MSTTNAVNGSPVTRAVRRWALDRFAGLTETDPEVDPTIAVDVDRLTGRYLHAFGWIDVTEADEPGHLRVEVTPRDDVAWQPPAQAPATIAPYGPRDFRSVDLGEQRPHLPLRPRRGRLPGGLDPAGLPPRPRVD